MIDLASTNWTDIIDYDPASGIARWRRRVSASAGAGDEIGSLTSNGYIKLLYRRKTYLLHRVVFYMATGLQPEEVDHINGVKTDNRIANLRAADRRKNEYNKPVSVLSKTGVKGVSFDGYGYRARARVNGRRVNIGYFKTLEEAEIAAIKFRSTYQGEFAHAA
ncbi:HNH endonuclease [Chromobacterium phragmitis]|uniref:HNH endonuclease n=1 Tax=Chromobacterium amazonense TaxID=1382803 RepID=UPI0021B8284C|nr:HNH endonuclease [Chromobacterium amazonense]MBM2884086.1 HNH endonuclease [Chromobacterium amazonense]